MKTGFNACVKGINQCQPVQVETFRYLQIFRISKDRYYTDCH